MTVVVAYRGDSVWPTQSRLVAIAAASSNVRRCGIIPTAAGRHLWSADAVGTTTPFVELGAVVPSIATTAGRDDHNLSVAADESDGQGTPNSESPAFSFLIKTPIGDYELLFVPASLGSLGDCRCMGDR